MANDEQVKILKQGSDAWNHWRKNTFVIVDLTGADFSGMDLSGAYLFSAHLKDAMLADVNLAGADLRSADLSKADLSRATLDRANLMEANLSDANLTQANLTNANLAKANLTESDLRKAKLGRANLTRADLGGSNLSEAYLSGADLSDANLADANLFGADLTETELSGTSLINVQINKAKLSRSSVYAVNAWDLDGEFEEQKDLIITRKGEPIITVDNIKIAQFIYLILNNEEIRDVLNTLTSKSVLILGRFALPERKEILDTLRNKLREYGLLPIVFDFDRPVDKDFTETIKTLAGLSYFVIADVTNPKSSPLELQATVPDYQIPFVPIIQEGERPFAMMVDLQKKYNWVLQTVTYDSMETLVKVLKPLVIDPAMKKRQELRLIKAQEPEVISGKEYLDKETK